MSDDETRFDGADYVPERDNPRLSSQLERIRELMKDGRWRTLAEIAEKARAPQASVSAQLRHLRKARFGSWIVEKQHRGEPKLGLYEYRIRPPARPPVQLDLSGYQPKKEPSNA